MGDKWLKIRSIDGGQFGIGKDGGGGDGGIEFEASGAPDGIEQAGGFFRMGFAERDDANRQCYTHDGESFDADGATLDFPPCHAGNGGLGQRTHEQSTGGDPQIAHEHEQAYEAVLLRSGIVWSPVRGWIESSCQENHLDLSCCRASAQHLNVMNVTLKLPDDLCHEAKHRAIDESKSLSAWVASLLERELAASKEASPKPRTLLEIYGSDEFSDRDFPLEDRRAGKVREFSFDD